MSETEARFVARCTGCGESWDIDYDPRGCTCDYADPDEPVAPWTLTLEATA